MDAHIKDPLPPIENNVASPNVVNRKQIGIKNTADWTFRLKMCASIEYSTTANKRAPMIPNSSVRASKNTPFSYVLSAEAASKKELLSPEDMILNPIPKKG